ncbi:hypothetical protein C7S18_06445 [Ahniella affigens]|uniref:Glyoxalase-like domain-containing protein n=1 Tax=Ahniella affigens TaxID=2021234 RepID=A0A2P1PPW4_9GAMM|nr:hypothetical protein [Ahniella affigens]AVP96862.1 hypothetical protein C7S18_06445 [Ahniella affigens]
MATPARAGTLIYAKNPSVVSRFYQGLLGARLLHADDEHEVLANADTQLIIHAIPAQYAESIVVSVPPVPRDEQATKPFFTIADLNAAESACIELGGLVLGPIWPGPGMRVRNVCDPEGNIIHLRQMHVDSR